MQLRKFASNSEEFMKAFEKSNWAADFELIGDNQKMNFPTKKALGVVWNTETDEFSFPTSEKLGLPKSLSQPITKRIILQELARVFDPIGIISPVLVNGRTILQDCWKAECGWDDIVPREAPESMARLDRRFTTSARSKDSTSPSTYKGRRQSQRDSITHVL
jgi:hypothetical protein